MKKKTEELSDKQLLIKGLEWSIEEVDREIELLNLQKIGLQKRLEDLKKGVGIEVKEG